MTDAALDLAVELIAKYEGFRAEPYMCPAKIPTIGYGTTWYPHGPRVTMNDKPCTQEQALEWLKHDAQVAEKAVDRLVTVPLKVAQHAALVSFVYNLGAAAFSASTLLLKLNRGDYDGAAGEFMRWTKGGGAVLPGLVKRRAEESALFVKP
jgi:lysozyme